MVRGALYVHVSTKEQTTENQERELRQWAERRTALTQKRRAMSRSSQFSSPSRVTFRGSSAMP